MVQPVRQGRTMARTISRNGGSCTWANMGTQVHYRMPGRGPRAAVLTEASPEARQGGQARAILEQGRERSWGALDWGDQC